MPADGGITRENRENRAETALKSGGGRQLIGILDVGHDLMRLKQRVPRHRVQIDGPVGLAGAGHADDVEFDTTAERMAFQGVINPGP